VSRTPPGVCRREWVARKTFSGWKRGRVVVRKMRAEIVRIVRARFVRFEAAWGVLVGAAAKER
jgi:hypothetical protein